MDNSRSSAFLLPAALICACSPIQPIERPVATSDLVRSDGRVIGDVQIYPQTTAVLLRIEAAGLPPGQHGVHVHAIGRCDAPAFETAGAHWNPTEAQHGHRNPKGPHIGDLGNLGVGADGTLSASLLIPGAHLQPRGEGKAIHDPDGSALVIHAKADDEQTDPSGNSGPRIACAVL